MRSRIARWARRSGLATALVASTAISAAGQPVRAFAPDRPAAPLDITESDVAESNRKIGMAYQALASMWSKSFDELGAAFEVPTIARYRGMVRTSCGVMPSNNALYCPSRNAIYFDEVFVARQAKAAARELGTDGDMVSVGIIAHEMGHAVAMQLGENGRVPFESERTADCLAGVFTMQSERDGNLEEGDLNEAFFGMAAAGDPTPEYTGDRRIDTRIAMRSQLLGHGSRDQRMQNFKAGYRGGAAACLVAFR